jgi:hypothetical protein
MLTATHEAMTREPISGTKDNAAGTALTLTAIAQVIATDDGTESKSSVSRLKNWVKLFRSHPADDVTHALRGASKEERAGAKADGGKARSPLTRTLQEAGMSEESATSRASEAGTIWRAYLKGFVPSADMGWHRAIKEARDILKANARASKEAKTGAEVGALFHAIQKANPGINAGDALEMAREQHVQEAERQAATKEAERRAERLAKDGLMAIPIAETQAEQAARLVAHYGAEYCVGLVRQISRKIDVAKVKADKAKGTIDRKAKAKAREEAKATAAERRTHAAEIAAPVPVEA